MYGKKRKILKKDGEIVCHLHAFEVACQVRQADVKVVHQQRLPLVHLLHQGRHRDGRAELGKVLDKVNRVIG